VLEIAQLAEVLEIADHVLSGIRIVSGVNQLLDQEAVNKLELLDAPLLLLVPAKNYPHVVNV